YVAFLLFEPERVGVIDAEERARVPVVERLLGHVHEGLAGYHRLRHAGDDADAELLLDVDLEHALPDTLAIAVVARASPLDIGLRELLHLGDVGGVADLVAGLVPLAE